MSKRYESYGVTIDNDIHLRAYVSILITLLGFLPLFNTFEFEGLACFVGAKGFDVSKPVVGKCRVLISILGPK